MGNIVDKVESTGNHNILLTERGTSFGYNTLVADMRGLPQMAKTGYPVVMDATHSVQQPGGKGGSSGGQREFAPVMRAQRYLWALVRCSLKPIRTRTRPRLTGQT